MNRLKAKLSWCFAEEESENRREDKYKYTKGDACHAGKEKKTSKVREGSERRGRRCRRVGLRIEKARMVPCKKILERQTRQPTAGVENEQKCLTCLKNSREPRGLVWQSRLGREWDGMAKALGRSLDLLLVKCKFFDSFSRRSGAP